VYSLEVPIHTSSASIDTVDISVSFVLLKDIIMKEYRFIQLQLVRLEGA
jgi:hypothetical protein